jgi:hypothetical protein
MWIAENLKTNQIFNNAAMSCMLVRLGVFPPKKKFSERRIVDFRGC